VPGDRIRENSYCMSMIDWIHATSGAAERGVAGGSEGLEGIRRTRKGGRAAAAEERGGMPRLHCACV